MSQADVDRERWLSGELDAEKKGGMSMEVIIVAAIALVVLVILAVLLAAGA